jgi:hypothetical protein
MYSIDCLTRDFSQAGTWPQAVASGVRNFTFSELWRAAITAGHESDWRNTILGQTGGRMEILWKTGAFLTAVRGSQHVGFFDEYPRLAENHLTYI